MDNYPALTDSVKAEAQRLGFFLVGVTTPDPLPGAAFYARWLAEGHHADMAYLSEPRAIERRANPRLILPECQSILVLGIPYFPPTAPADGLTGRVASYAWGEDYHLVLPEKLSALVAFIEAETGRQVPNRWYTDTGPLLERELGQRAGLGWVGRNSCLIHPGKGSTFLLAEILLGIPLVPDPPFESDHCGTCTRCLDACPTGCILPDRSLDARRCISYLTIENKGEIPAELRDRLGNWVFGCDICQQVCPWNRFAGPGDPAFAPREGLPAPNLAAELALSAEEFNRKFKNSPVKRAKRRGYLRNVAVALDNSGDAGAIHALRQCLDDPEPLVREHAAAALEKLQTTRQ